MERTAQVRRWTLERESGLLTHPDDSALPFPLEWQQDLSVDRYLSLYTGVGEVWNWFDRRMMSSKELTGLLQQANREFAVFRDVSNAVMGFAEVVVHSPQNVEIAYFGLFPEATGRGLGSGFMRAVLRRAQSESENCRVWLTTCEWDSPAALPFYQRMGFRIVAEDIVAQKVPPGFALPESLNAPTGGAANPEDRD